MSAAVEQLRRAAEQIREHAETASAGPWEHGHVGLQAGEQVYNGEVRVARVYANEDDGRACENARHIATWDPTAACAVADLLDAGADEIERRVARDGEEILERANPVFHAMRELARTYLEEDA